jgi:hypothetical protein
MKKKRADSVLDKLPPNQRATLEGWLFNDNLSYTDAAKKLWEDFNVRVSPSSLSSFWQECSQRRLLDRIASSGVKVNEAVGQFRKSQAQTLEAMEGMVGTIAFEKSMKDGDEFDPKTIANFTSLMIEIKKLAIKEAELSLDQRRVILLEKKAKQADDAAEIVESKLSPEEKQKKLKSIFGIQ